MAIMVDSPHHAYDQVRFTISEVGIQDARRQEVNREY